MIISLFRNKKTYIYIFIISVIFTILFLFLFLIVHVLSLKKDFVYKNSLAYYESDSNVENGFSNTSKVDFFRMIKFDEINDSNLSKIMTNELLYDKYFSYYNDEIVDNQIILYLPDYFYENIDKNKYLNQIVDIIKDTNKYYFIIKDIRKSDTNSYFEISSDKYNDLIKEESNYIYFLKYRCSDIELLEMYNNAKIISMHNQYMDKQLYTIQNYFKTILYSFFGFIIITFIIILVVSINIINDEKRKTLMLKYIGFSQNRILFYKFKLLSLIYGISLLISVIISLLLLVFFRMVL